MRPELFRLDVDFATSLALYLFFLAITFVVALLGRAKGTSLRAAAPKAFRSSLLASLTCGLLGSRDPARRDASKREKPEDAADLFIPGTLATLAGVVPLAIVLARGKFELPVQSYPLAAALGFVVVIVVAARRLLARGFDQAHILDVAIICIVVGPIGSRIFFVAQFWDDYFADRPAAVESGPLVPFQKGEELAVRTQAGAASATFEGDESTWEAVQARLAPLEAAGVRTKLVTLERRVVGGEIQRVVRGLAIETLVRGNRASLEVSGPAARKLGLATMLPGGNHGLDVPWQETLKIWNGGIVFYGGLIAATLCSILYLRFRRYPILSFADGIAPVLGIGLAFGRVGCTLNGCCWGRECDPGFALGVHFPVGSHPWIQHVRSVLSPAFDLMLDTRPFESAGHLQAPLEAALPADLTQASHWIHPVQLYDAFGDLSLALVVYLFSRTLAKRDGQTFFLFFICYSLSRFASEHFRGDHGHFMRALGYPFTISQVVSLLTLPVGVGLFVWASRRAAKSPAREPAPVPQVEGTAKS